MFEKKNLQEGSTFMQRPLAWSSTYLLPYRRDEKLENDNGTVGQNIDQK